MRTSGSLGWSYASAALVLTLFLASFASVLFGLAVIDTDRDLANATAIALGVEWPWRGPRIGGIWSVGPVWFYLLSLPLMVVRHFGALLFALALFSALKVPLAAWLGRRLFGEPAGLALAALVCLPGWWWVGNLASSHASTTESAVLATLLAVWHCRAAATTRGRLLWSGLAGLLFCLALHAHPTTIVLAPLLAVLLASTWRRLPASLGAFLVAGTLPLLPVLILELRRDTAQMAATAIHWAQLDVLAQLRNLPEHVLGLLFGGQTFADTLLQSRDRPLPLLWLQSLGLWVLALWGALRSRRHGDTRWLWLCIYLLLALALIVMLRSFVAPWMVYTLLPIVALLQLNGMRQMAPRAFRAGAWAVAVLALLGLLMQLQLMLRAQHQGELWVVRNRAVNVAAHAAAPGSFRSHLALFDLTRLVRRLCREDMPWRLHGELAALVHMGGGAATALTCTTPPPTLAGQGPGVSLIGLPLGLLERELGPPSGAMRRFAGFALIEPRAVLGPAEGLPLQLSTEYWPERAAMLGIGAPEQRQIDIECAGGEWVLATDLSLGMLPPRIEMHRDSQPLAPQLRYGFSQFWRCDGDPVSLRITTTSLAHLDLVRFAYAASDGLEQVSH